MEPMFIACAAGAAAKWFEEHVRRQHLDVALADRLDREESRRAEEMIGASPVYERWILGWLLFVSPRRAVRRLRRKLATQAARHGRVDGD